MSILSDIEKNTFSSLLSDLVSIASVKGEPQEGAPYGPLPKAALSYLLERAEKDGFTAVNVGDKAGYIQWGSKGPLLAILGHLDVVPEGEGWETPAFSLTETETHFAGRGVIDDKGPVLSAYMAMLRFQKNHPDPDFRVRLIVGTDEEHGSSCMVRYCETEELPDIGFTPDAEFPCIFAEKGIYQMHFSGKPTKDYSMHGGNAANMVPPSCKAIITSSGNALQTKGLQAHASHPDLGINAIDLMLKELPEEILSSSPVLLLMKKYFSFESQNRFAGFFQEDISGPMTTNVGIVNIDENECSLHVDIRFPVNTKAEDVRQKLNEIALEFGVEVVDDGVQPPLFKDKSSRQIEILTGIYGKYQEQFDFIPEEKEARQNELSKEVAPIAIGGGTYARTMPNIVAFGPQLPWAKDQCHQANESILKKNLYLLVPMYEEALEKLGQSLIK